MTEAAIVSSEIEVAVSPGVAFTVFTEEMDLWWVRGPINFSDAGRVVEVRCEPGVGGRIGEVLDDRTSGPTREKARITVWEPGVRLCWASSVDDVETEVRFEPTDAHLAHSEQAGATIPHRKEWPWLPAYVAEDPEGHRWTFAQARPTQRP